MALTFRQEVCSGCRTCELICSFTNFQEVNTKKSGIRIKESNKPGRYTARICSGCGRCMEVCPAEAISMEAGRVKIDASLCTGCLTCVDSCPEEAIFMMPGSEIPFMCNSCGACVQYCSPKALSL